MHEVAIALGTNLGERLQNLIAACSAFQPLRASDRWYQSSVYATSPVGCPEGSPDFYNAVIVFDYSGSPEELLRECKAIEQQQGRDLKLNITNAPRPIDADILYFGAHTRSSESLTIPHPRMLQRRFVLEPLAEIRPDHQLPNTTLSVQELLLQLDSAEPPLTHITNNWYTEA